jgi:hypothetical protein
MQMKSLFLSSVAALVIFAAQEFANVRRFYRKSFSLGTAPAQNAGTAGQICLTNQIASGEPSVAISFDPPMNSTPTITTYNPSAANANWRDETSSSDVTVNLPSAAKSSAAFTIAAASTIANVGDLACVHYTADAGL